MLTSVKKFFHLRKNEEKGFSLVEILVSLTMIALLVSTLASLTTLTAKTQVKLLKVRAANNLLQQEVAYVESLPWDDVMMAPNSGTGYCLLGASNKEERMSSQLIKPTERYVSEGIPMDVTRSVKWYSSGDSVACDVTPNDRTELKTATITVTWDIDSATPQSRTATVYLSKHRNFNSAGAKATTGQNYSGTISLGTTYSSRVQADGPPIGWWRLAEPSGTTAVNMIPGGQNGTYINSPTMQTGKLADDGNSVTLNGTNQSVNLATQNNMNLVTTPAFTVEGWFQPVSVSSATPQIIYEEGGATNGINVYIKSGVLTAHMWTGGVTRSQISTPITDGENHHFAYIFDANGGPRTELILDGSSMGSPTVNTNVALVAHGDANAIGIVRGSTLLPGPVVSSGDGTWAFQGKVGDVARYDKALTRKKAAQHYEMLGNPPIASSVSSPGAPVNGTATPTLTGKITVRWDQPPFTGGGIISKYVIERNDEASYTDATGWTGPSDGWVKVGESTQLSYIDQNLSRNKRYLYRVSAVNESGQGTFSATIDGLPGFDPLKPELIGEPVYIPSTGNVVLTFKAVDGEGYSVDYLGSYSTAATGGVNPDNPPASSQAVITCNTDNICEAKWVGFETKIGTKWYFYLFAKNSLGYGSPAIVSATAPSVDGILESYIDYTSAYCASGLTDLGTGLCRERAPYTYTPYSYWVCTNQSFDNCGPPLHPDGSYYCYCGTLGGCGGGDCCGWVCHSGYWATGYSLNAKPGWTNSGTDWYRDVAKISVNFYGLRTTFTYGDDGFKARNLGSITISGGYALNASGKTGAIGRCPTAPITYTVKGIGGTGTGSIPTMPCN